MARAAGMLPRASDANRLGETRLTRCAAEASAEPDLRKKLGKEQQGIEGDANATGRFLNLSRSPRETGVRLMRVQHHFDPNLFQVLLRFEIAAISVF